MSASMVVVPEPVVKCFPALAGGAVDGAVDLAVDQRADEAFGFAVCLWPVGAGAEVFDAEAATGERVDGGAVGAAVVGEDRLDLDAVGPNQECNKHLESTSVVRVVLNKSSDTGAGYYSRYSDGPISA